MQCKLCGRCIKGFLRDRPNDFVCVNTGDVKLIEDINQECTQCLPDDYPSGMNWFDAQRRPDTDYYGELRLPIFYMLVGVPGSGKTTMAERFMESDPTVVHISSDIIRGKLWGDETCQKNPDEVFRVMGEETLKTLNSGYSVIYDATNVTRKNRRNILEKLPSWVIKECLICWAPVEVCVERDRARERTVGPDVIDKMLRRFEAPYYDEGFDTITVAVTNSKDHDVHGYFKNLLMDMYIPHDNPHHRANVLEHCRLCGVGLIDSSVPDVVVTAGFLHDVGKPYCKTFVNKKGETTETAHYYGHQAVGAWLSYGIQGHSPTLAWLISTHMAPYINKKYHESLPPLWKKWIDELHRADVEAH